MNMKKIRVMLAGLVLTMALGGLTACGNGVKDNNNGTTNNNNTTGGATTEGGAVVNDVVDGVGEAGKDIINGVENGVDDMTGEGDNATNGDTTTGTAR